MVVSFFRCISDPSSSSTTIISIMMVVAAMTTTTTMITIITAARVIAISIIYNHHQNYNNRGVEMEVPTTSMPSLHPQQCRVDVEDVKPLVEMFEIRQAFTIELG